MGEMFEIEKLRKENKDLKLSISDARRALEKIKMCKHNDFDDGEMWASEIAEEALDALSRPARGSE